MNFSGNLFLDQSALVFTTPDPEASIQVTGTFVGTLIFEVTVDGINWAGANGYPLGSTTGQASTTAPGVFRIGKGGFYAGRVRMHPYTSGTASITVNTGAAESTDIGAGGGGGGAVSSVFGRTGAVTAQTGDYTAAQVGATVTGADLIQAGGWNATSNSPTLASGVGTQGYYYEVTTGGTTTLDGISVWNVGDIAWFDGTVWQRTLGGNSVIKPDGTIAFSANQSMGSHKLTNVTDPASAQDAATKNYVDAQIVQAQAGINAKPSCKLATAAALASNTYSNGASGVGATLTGVATGVLTVDGVAVALNDRILVNNEVAGANNGIYLCTIAGAGGVAYVLTRATDCDQSTEFPGAYTLIEAGTANADRSYIFTGSTAPTVGTTAIEWTRWNTGDVTSVAGRTGAVTLAVADVSGALASANNLSDVGSVSTSRTNLGVRTPSLNFLLCEGFTPGGTGADVGWIMVPYDPVDGTSSLTYNVRRIDFIVSTGGGAPQVTVEVAPSAGAGFITVGSVTLGSGAQKGNKTFSFTTSTVSSGQIIRFNVNTLGTATGWTVSLQVGV